MIPFASQRKDAEDVLSSIRKMVSEEAKAKTTETMSRLELTAADMVPPETLVLTSDQAIEELANQPENHPDPIADALNGQKQASDSMTDDPPGPKDAVGAAADAVEEPEDSSTNGEIYVAASEFDVPSDDIAPMPAAQMIDIEEVPTELPGSADEPELEQPAAIAPVVPIVGQNGSEADTNNTDDDAEIESETQRSPNLLLDEIDAEDAPFMDEFAMRKMVSEMIREELEGEMGERITRNIRRLIRREIARALSMKT